MQSEHGILGQEEEEKYTGGSMREEKVNSNQNQSHSMQEVDDISAEFEYFETLMTAFAESVSSTTSERRM